LFTVVISCRRGVRSPPEHDRCPLRGHLYVAWLSLMPPCGHDSVDHYFLSYCVFKVRPPRLKRPSPYGKVALHATWRSKQDERPLREPGSFPPWTFCVAGSAPAWEVHAVQRLLQALGFQKAP